MVLELVDRLRSGTTAHTDDDEDITDFDGWYCIKTTKNCREHRTMYVHTARQGIIIVWPEIDDNALLRIAAETRDLGLLDKIMLYETSMGRAKSFYEIDIHKDGVSA